MYMEEKRKKTTNQRRQLINPSVQRCVLRAHVCDPRNVMPPYVDGHWAVSSRRGRRDSQTSLIVGAIYLTRHKSHFLHQGGHARGHISTVRRGNSLHRNQPGNPVWNLAWPLCLGTQDNGLVTRDGLSGTVSTSESSPAQNPSLAFFRLPKTIAGTRIELVNSDCSLFPVPWNL
jgi:hypothetical protein